MEEPKILNFAATPKYVVGFLFNPDYSRVVLIKKTKPAWQNNLINGVGGKTEPGETAAEAMSREFREETGVEALLGWYPFAEFYSGACDPSSPHATIACFTACTDDETLDSVKTTTEEEVVIVDAKNMYNEKTVPNLKWLVPLAIDYHRDGGIKIAKIQF